MSEIPRCPFCGNKPEKVGAFSAQCRGLVDGKDIHNTIVMNNEAWNRRTPAPEGEAVAWGCFDANGLDDKMVYRDRRRAEDAAFAFTPSLTVNALYASPVVPVGSGEAVAALRARYEKVKATPYSPGTPAERMKEGELHGLNTALAIVMALDDRLASPVVPVGVSKDQEATVVNALIAFANAVEGQSRSRRMALACEHTKALVAALRPTDTWWRDIATAPRDGTEFQGWIGQWEPRCRFNPETEAFETWGRVDYDENGWEVSDVATHWMPLPSAPTDTGRE
jgi:hypothetical protein